MKYIDIGCNFIVEIYIMGSIGVNIMIDLLK